MPHHRSNKILADLNVINESALDPKVKAVLIKYCKRAEQASVSSKNNERNTTILFILWICTFGFFILSIYITLINPPNMVQCPKCIEYNPKIDLLSTKNNAPKTPTAIRPGVPSVISTSIPKPKFRVFLFNSQDSPMVEGILQQYFINNLKEYENIILEFLSFDEKSKQFFSSQGEVSSEILKESLNLFIFHKTANRFGGQWSEDKYDKLLKGSNGNCIWTYTENHKPLDVSYAPTIPDGVLSGINLYTDKKTSTVLKFNIYKNTFNDDEFNKVNLQKLKNLISTKFNLNKN